MHPDEIQLQLTKQMLDMHLKECDKRSDEFKEWRQVIRGLLADMEERVQKSLEAADAKWSKRLDSFDAKLWGAIGAIGVAIVIQIILKVI